MCFVKIGRRCFTLLRRRLAVFYGFMSRTMRGLALLITRRTWGTVLSLIFIGAEVLGRIDLILVGVASRRGSDLVKIVIGGVIAVGFMLYIGLRSFSRA